MNKVFLVGRLSADPILKTTNKGIEFVNITVAVNDLRNKNDSYFLPCVGWNTTATFINQYLKKGDLVGIDGRITRRSYVNKEGKQTYVTEVVIDNINSLSKAKVNDNSEFNKIFTESNESSSSDTQSLDELTNMLNEEKGED